MSFYWIKTNSFIKKLFSKYIWDIPNKEKTIYLTFDDGPTVEITKWILSTLKNYNVKATFFCIGKNIRSNPILFSKLLEDGHSIGNHTFNHIKGWRTTTNQYLNDIYQTEKLIEELSSVHNKTLKPRQKLFRPPYGKIKPSQSKKLRKSGYKIIMWDVLSADYDKNISPEKCLKNVIDNVKSGSIIIFHDSIKASKNMQFALPRTLEFLSEKGFQFGIID